MIYKSGKKYDALLIDLDGTLLEIDLEKFILAYVDLLSKRFKKYLGFGNWKNRKYG